MAGVAYFVVVQSRIFLIAVEAVLAVSLLTGFALVRRFFRSSTSCAKARSCSRTATSCRASARSGQADVDRLIQVYNRMADALRGERVQLQEQQHFLALILRSSPGGIVVLDFDGRVTLANPAAERLLQADAGTLISRG